MTAQKTRCPFCESVFAVTPEQLAARGGHVRCGKCFQVFKADDHLVKDTPAPAVKPIAQESALSSVFDLLDSPAPKTAASPEVTLAGQSAQPIRDLTALEKPADLDADFERLFAGMAPVEVDLDQGYAQTSQADEVHQADVVEVATARIQDTTPPGIPKVVPKQLSAIKPLFLEDSAPAAKPATATANASRAKSPILVLDDEFSDLFLGDKSQKMDALQQDEIKGVEKLSAAADESWAEALLQEESDQGKRKEIAPPPPKSKPKPAEAKLPKSEIISDLPKAAELTASSRHSHDDDDLLSFLSKAGATTNGQMEALAPLPSKAAPKAHAAPPPPASHRVLKPTKVPVPWLNLAGWGIASALMLILLVVQYFYFNFERMVSTPKYHALMTKVCGIAGCHVPSIDPSKIELRKVTAKKHPTRADLTRFSLTMVNSASSSQPMPALKLTIRESDGQIRAGRLIQPSEYLFGGALGMMRIPPNSPLKLSVDIRVQRKSFDNYSIDPVY
jgi:predicted Zn finger-like uncharacterized protein